MARECIGIVVVAACSGVGASSVVTTLDPDLVLVDLSVWVPLREVRVVLSEFTDDSLCDLGGASFTEEPVVEGGA